jgi:hypothetical protein
VNKPCLDCGTLSPNTRCPTHTRAKDRARGTTTQRGYNAEHQRLRAQLVATYLATDPCPRCGLPLGPDPSLLDLGHTEDRTAWTGLEHRAHNRATAAKRRS